MLKLEPKEITKDIDTGIETASFDYYTGIYLAKLLSMKQSTSFSDLKDRQHFIVCCGDVMISVDSTEFPDIERRLF